MQVDDEKRFVLCPGCGILVPHQGLEESTRHNASGECWQLYNELTYYTLSLQDPLFPHQHIVDAYGAQHSGGESKNITVAFALIGLYLTLEKGYSGREVQRAHMMLTQISKAWPRLSPPLKAGIVTVADVLHAEVGLKRNGMIETWAESVWSSWVTEHERVKNICKTWLNV